MHDPDWTCHRKVFTEPRDHGVLPDEFPLLIRLQLPQPTIDLSTEEPIGLPEPVQPHRPPIDSGKFRERVDQLQPDPVSQRRIIGETRRQGVRWHEPHDPFHHEEGRPDQRWIVTLREEASVPHAGPAEGRQEPGLTCHAAGTRRHLVRRWPAEDHFVLTVPEQHHVVRSALPDADGLDHELALSEGVLVEPRCERPAVVGAQPRGGGHSSAVLALSGRPRDDAIVVIPLQRSCTGLTHTLHSSTAPGHRSPRQPIILDIDVGIIFVDLDDLVNSESDSQRESTVHALIPGAP